MTHEEKIKYMQIAADMCQFGMKLKHVDLFLSLYELIISKGGNADMVDVAKVKAEIEGRYYLEEPKTEL